MCAVCGCGTGTGVRVSGHPHTSAEEQVSFGNEHVHSDGAGALVDGHAHSHGHVPLGNEHVHAHGHGALGNEHVHSHGQGALGNEHVHSHGHGALGNERVHSHGHGALLEGHVHSHSDGEPAPWNSGEDGFDPPGSLRLSTSSRMARLEIDLLEKNNRLATTNRSWLGQRGILALNLMGSPGAGKTALLEQTAIRLGRELVVTVLEGDQETDADAQRIRAAGCRAVQINTGAGCHLDAEMVALGLRRLEPDRRSVVFMENVGNLVCPALFDLGESVRVVVLSVTEGEDKPLKYPHVFRAADVLILNKIDLLPHLSFDAERCLENARQVKPGLRIFEISATRGDGVDGWCDWLRQEVRGFQPVS